ncbi:MAG TPA: hypothetical protein VMA36_16050 [Candidatus Limnocylindria bacterium]|nr:hypothetical protein [Candidatus Limnocylindria bacterium]
MRIWNGAGDGAFPFATGPSVIGQSAPQLSLVPAAGSSAPPVVADATLSATTVFPATPAGQWVTFRCGFSLTQPTSGSYVWELNAFPLAPFYDSCIAASTGFYHPFSGSPPQFVLQSDGTGTTPSTALCTAHAPFEASPRPTPRTL